MTTYYTVVLLRPSKDGKSYIKNPTADVGGGMQATILGIGCPPGEEDGMDVGEIARQAKLLITTDPKVATSRALSYIEFCGTLENTYHVVEFEYDDG